MRRTAVAVVVCCTALHVQLDVGPIRGMELNVLGRAMYYVYAVPANE